MWLRSLALTLALAVPQASPAQSAAGVPPAYQDIYADLARTLEAFMASLPPATGAPVDFGAELSYADANRLEQLLAPFSREGALAAVDRLADMGLEAITVNISYPMLYRPFHTGPAEYARSLAFYKAVAATARKRGLKLIVKSGALMATDPRVRTFYRSVGSLDEYKAGRLQVAATILREIAPDYLTVVAEPDVEAQQTGQPVGTAGGAYDLTAFLVGGLARSARQTRLGAGAGTWHGEFAELVTELATLRGLSYVDLHVYPINRDFLWRTLEASDVAHRAGKDVAMSETWTYKIRDRELPLSPALFMQVIARDVFSFWEPLDVRFVEVMTRLAAGKSFAFLSLFWTKYFFSYLEYDRTLFLPPDELVGRSQLRATQAMMEGTLTRTGESYRRSIRGTRAPARAGRARPAETTRTEDRRSARGNRGRGSGPPPFVGCHGTETTRSGFTVTARPSYQMRRAAAGLVRGR